MGDSEKVESKETKQPTSEKPKEAPKEAAKPVLAGKEREARGPEGRRKPKRPPRRRQRFQKDSEFTEKVVSVNRVSKVVQGGKNFSFAALVVVGDGKGRVGFSIGKAREVADAIQKGLKHAKNSMTRVPLAGTTIPHEMVVRFGAAKVFMKPASKGTGVIAGSAVRAVCECAGIKDILTKSLGSQTALNVVQATLKGLKTMITRSDTNQIPEAATASVEKPTNNIKGS